MSNDDIKVFIKPALAGIDEDSAISSRKIGLLVNAEQKKQLIGPTSEKKIKSLLLIH